MCIMVAAIKFIIAINYSYKLLATPTSRQGGVDLGENEKTRQAY